MNSKGISQPSQDPEALCTISVLIPCFNESNTIAKIIELVNSALDGYAFELIVVDDCSTDDSIFVLREMLRSMSFKLIEREKNGGKGAAVRDALSVATGEWIVIQDADLEYDPYDIPRLMGAANTNDVAVYGRRTKNLRKVTRIIFWVGVLGIDTLIWFLFGKLIPDHATCYKVVRREVLNDMNLDAKGFAVCVEITCKLLRMGYDVKQFPISYSPRGWKEGKKLAWTHGFHAMTEAFRCFLWKPPTKERSRVQL